MNNLQKIKRKSIPSKIISTLPSQIIYARYADDWVLLLSGNKERAIRHKRKIEKFILKRLKLQLDKEKTIITHIQDGVNFLGYTVKMYSDQQKKIMNVLYKRGDKITRIKKATTSRKINIFPDKNRVLKNIKLRKYTNPQLFPIGIPQWSI